MMRLLNHQHNDNTTTKMFARVSLSLGSCIIHTTTKMFARVSLSLATGTCIIH